MRARDLILSPQLDQQEVLAYLERRGFSDPQRADDHLQEITRRVGVPERVADLADLLLDEIADSVDPDAAVRNLESFIETVPSPLNLLTLIGNDPYSLEVLIGLLASSPYLTQCLVRNPEYLYWLIEGRRLERICDVSYFRKEAEEMIRPFPDAEQALDALRRLNRRELLRIGSQDLLGRSNLEATVRQLSDLADVLLQKTFEVLARGSLPNLEGFAVLALGKLGGRELNFSSDIDLLFIFARDEESDLVLRFARDYTRALGAFTSDGHLYRVDLRLRPMGRSGEIAYSEKACRQYYQTWADTTDRLALIKCRYSAGDSTLGNRFVNSIQDFVFKKYLDQAAVEEIRWIKKKTDEALRRSRETHTHVKLGLGGIREIEFFAQSFQILYGGIHPEVRTPNTLTALQRLLDDGYINSSQYEILCEAYVFLRDLEHKLQLVHDVQTHSLPQERDELLRCARRMGYRRIGDESDDDILNRFYSDLRRHNRNVREIFDGLFEDATDSRGLEEIVLSPSMGKKEAIRRLRSHQIAMPEQVFEGIKMLREAPAFPHSPSRIRNLLANLVPHLINWTARARSPRDLFNRLDRFCEKLGSRANLYTEVIENASLREKLFRLLASGEFLAETLIQNPELLDTVAHTWLPERYLPELDGLLVRRSPGERPQALRTFKRREEFKIALQELAEPGNPDTRRRLTELAEAALQTVCRECMERDQALGESDFSILGLGKLGGEELIFHSDLDLVVVYNDECSVESVRAVSNLLKDLRSWLQAYTDVGRAYQIDFRLRPEGRHGAEAVPLSQLIHYFEERAEPWERLAYVKARPVVERGQPIPLEALVFHAPFTEQEIQRLRRIRQRKEREIGREESRGHLDPKVGKGSLLDIQFIVQLLQVNSNIADPNLLSALDRLEASSLIDRDHASELRRGIEFLYAVESMDDLLDGGQNGKLSRQSAANDRLATWLGRESGQVLTEQYLALTSSIREIYIRYFGEEPG